MDVSMTAEAVSHAQETLEGCPGTEPYFWMDPSQIKSVERKKKKLTRMSENRNFNSSYEETNKQKKNCKPTITDSCRDRG